MLLTIGLFMFDIGWGELVLIGIVALIAIGPKELPGVLRTAGQMMGKARRMAAEFQGQFQEAMREAEMADLKKTFDDAANAATSATAAIGNPLDTVRDEIKSAVEASDKPAGAAEPAAPLPEIEVPLPEQVPVDLSDIAPAEPKPAAPKSGES